MKDVPEKISLVRLPYKKNKFYLFDIKKQKLKRVSKQVEEANFYDDSIGHGSGGKFKGVWCIQFRYKDMFYLLIDKHILNLTKNNYILRWSGGESWKREFIIQDTNDNIIFYKRYYYPIYIYSGDLFGDIYWELNHSDSFNKLLQESRKKLENNQHR